MARYIPGDWHAVVTPNGAALLAGTVPPAALEQIWEGLVAGRGLGAVIDGLFGSFGSSLAGIPDFGAAVIHADGSVRVAARGATTVRVATLSGAAHESDGRGAATWAEQLVPAAETVDLANGVTGDASLPIRDGIVRASALHLDVRSAAAVATGDPAERVDVPPEPEPAGADPVAEADPVLEAVPVAEADPAAEPFPSAGGETTITGYAVEETSRVDGADEAVEDHADTYDEYDELLFGETRMSTIEDAAIRENESATPGSATSGMIAGLPPFRPGTVDGAFEVLDGDHDGETISVEQMQQLQGGLQASGTPGEEPSPEASVALATLVVSTGERYLLDRGAVVGRRPRLNRVLGGRAPHLVAVPSPNQDVSRAHLELRVEGPHVLAIDLDTTNGTRLLRAGKEPMRLHPGEMTLLVPGDRLDIGDGNVLAFEGLA